MKFITESPKITGYIKLPAKPTTGISDAPRVDNLPIIGGANVPNVSKIIDLEIDNKIVDVINLNLNRAMLKVNINEILKTFPAISDPDLSVLKIDNDKISFNKNNQNQIYHKQYAIKSKGSYSISKLLSKENPFKGYTVAEVATIKENKLVSSVVAGHVTSYMELVEKKEVKSVSKLLNNLTYVKYIDFTRFYNVLPDTQQYYIVFYFRGYRREIQHLYVISIPLKAIYLHGLLKYRNL